jgi:hypothetical protein
LGEYRGQCQEQAGWDQPVEHIVRHPQTVAEGPIYWCL